MTNPQCYCGSSMVLRTSTLYGGFWGCSRWPDCDGKVGAHPDGTPLGTPADAETRQARIHAHRVFDEWWRSQGWKRRRAYRWLAQNAARHHIAEMTEEDCDHLVQLIEGQP